MYVSNYDTHIGNKAKSIFDVRIILKPYKPHYYDLRSNHKFCSSSSR